MKPAALHVQGLSVAYGRSRAVDAVDFVVPSGSLVTIVGANGAGKTSLLNAVMGVLPSTGSVAFGADQIGQWTLERRVAAGIRLVPERRELFADMSVELNLNLGGFRNSRRDRATEIQVVFDLFPRLRERRHQLAGTLSGGERQMLAMGRALMAKPRLLMLDEPSLGLAPRIVRDIFHILVELKKAGVTILLVEQNARAALQIADQGLVLELGRITAKGNADELAKDGRLVERYFGKASASEGQSIDRNQETKGETK